MKKGISLLNKIRYKIWKHFDKKLRKKKIIPDGFGAICGGENGVSKEILKNLAEEYSILCIPAFGIGDSVVIFSCIGEYKKRKNRKVCCLVFGGKIHTLLARMYPNINIVIPMDKNSYGNVLEAFRNNSNFEFLHNMYERPAGNGIESRKFRNMLDAVKIRFGLSGDFELDKIEISSADAAEADRIFSEMGLEKNKTIMAINEAITFDDVVEDGFWERLANAARSMGYTMVFNSKEKVVDGYQNVFLPLNLVLPFCQLCGNVIGLRTGLMDFICANARNIKIQAIYPNNSSSSFNKVNLDNFHRDFDVDMDLDLAGRQMEVCSLSRMFPNSNTIDHIYGTDAEFIDKLLKNIKQ